MRTLILGGARSGKSSFGESLLATHPEVTYVATARVPGDSDFAARVEKHRARRPAHWVTEDERDLIEVLRATPSSSLLVDDLGTWLTHRIDRAAAWESDEDSVYEATGIPALLEAISAFPEDRDLVIITPEVGMGISPAFSSGRLFRDVIGRLNADVASCVDHVYFVAAGIPLRLR
ncbi:MAG: bifunctional adenosylcobinamide kinase/adenosylcobinamide-phosphate guanylyltransferase [Corynebacterium sp.]|nr:bifunctional adenosylcobinamide kinase/adenosylcobinamide-phosphate guanylyltransferase [Corynebacterium sp.]